MGQPRQEEILLDEELFHLQPIVAINLKLVKEQLVQTIIKQMVIKYMTKARLLLVKLIIGN